ncbi:MAG: hypothetical protein ACLRJV_20390 [Eubacteriales bacterium]
MRLEAAISAQEAEIAKYRTLKTSVYEDLRDGLITQDEFLHMKQDFLKGFLSSKMIFRV